MCTRHRDSVYRLSLDCAAYTSHGITLVDVTVDNFRSKSALEFTLRIKFLQRIHNSIGIVPASMPQEKYADARRIMQ